MNPINITLLVLLLIFLVFGRGDDMGGIMAHQQFHEIHFEGFPHTDAIADMVISETGQLMTNDQLMQLETTLRDQGRPPAIYCECGDVTCRVTIQYFTDHQANE